MRRGVLLLCLAAALVVALALAGTASAVQATYYTYKITNVRSTGTKQVWQGWKASGWGPVALHISETDTVANSYSAGFTVPAGVVSAAVGYSVTYSRSVTVGGSYSVPRGLFGWLGYSHVYNLKAYTVTRYWHIASGGSGVDAVTTGTSRSYSNLQFYHHTGTTTARPPAPI